MGLLGRTAVAIYSDYAEEHREEHARFHSHEHILERLSTRGFLRGRRCRALDAASPSVFALYEVADRTITIQGEYIDKLNNPTPWTRKFRPLARYASRTLCDVVASAGQGSGAFLMTLRFSPQDGRRDELRRWLADDVVPSLAGSGSRTAAHLLARDLTIERPLTREEMICANGAGSVQSDWLLVVEGWDEAALRALQRRDLHDGQLEAHGAKPGAVYDMYALAHLLTHEEMTTVPLQA